ARAQSPSTCKKLTPWRLESGHAESLLHRGPDMTYQFISSEKKDRVGLITLNRPKQMNALNPQLMQELGAALQAFDGDDGIGAIVITGNEKAFAAGADIGVMKDYSYMDAYLSDYITRDWEHVRRIRKPV